MQIEGQFDFLDKIPKQREIRGFTIDKPIRLIELFAGYGSQSFALDYLDVKYESWKICEWAVKSIQAYKDAHFQEDNTDYSKDLTDEEVLNYLFNKGISQNYNEPMTYEQIKRLGIQKQRQIYNNIRATHNLVNIQQVKGEDLEIVDTDKYCYVMTYSFPCQDLSSAGLGKGMGKGSGTRSGMLWEVERILTEIKNNGEELPQVLLMENVPQIHGKKNIDDFNMWVHKLRELGYNSQWKDLNAKDYGVPQNRNRCFMVSTLSKQEYVFPKPIVLDKRLKDLLEENVDEKYYLSDKMLNYCMGINQKESKFPRKKRFLQSLENTNTKGIATAVTTNAGNRPIDNFITEPIACELRCDEGIRTFTSNVMGTLRTIDACGGKHIIEPKNNLKQQLCNDLIQSGKVKEYDIIRHNYSTSRINEEMKDIQQNNMSPTLDTRCDCLGVVVNDVDEFIKYNNSKAKHQQDLLQSEDGLCRTIPAGTHASTPHLLKTIVSDKVESLYTETEDKPSVKQNLRIRKLTPKECFRLMGVKDENFEKIAKNQSNASLYHLAGDSIVVNVLMNIFKNLFKE